jgi:Spy/CpxP family protein refolding chaperone
MKNPWRTFLVMLVVTVIAAAAAGWAGVQYGLDRGDSTADLDAVIHHDLHLTAEQDRAIRKLEADLATERADLQAKMRAANRELAAAITERHSYDAPAREAVERLHAAMSALQEKTILHVLAIRALLTPEQARDFDNKVSKALGAAPS